MTVTLTRVPQNSACSTCSFDVWKPIANLDGTHLGLYSDVRFPGRCILSYGEHFDRYEDMRPDDVFSFSMAIKNCAEAIRRATGADRVNVAVLGNTESHVHAHLIPRKVANEPKPTKAPWEDTRAKGSLTLDEDERLMARIWDELGKIYVGSANYPAQPVSEPTASTIEEQALFTSLDF